MNNIMITPIQAHFFSLRISRMATMLAVCRLVVFLTAVHTVSARGRPINIFEQKEGGDITQLREKGR
ncbi:hypothetical protein ANCCAN_10720 [Ancylostoma caninum]|uniref:Uncharacterized protein n=1 Tax=Ancylostoma caninum TaxID=29170 RepID=A0A368GFZ3_ANCCA|nr:hypothetical protein ANCCAN_10720 [Ancylostoma caninum]